MSRWRSGLLAVLLVLLVWQGAASLGLWPRNLFPPPSDIGLTLWRLSLSGELALALLHTLKRIGVGFLAVALGGGLLGLAMTRSQRLLELVGPVVQGLQAMPSICWYPLAILWFGMDEAAILFVTVAGSLFAVASATASAIRNIPPTYFRAAATMGARGYTLYTRVVLPAALPSLLTGLRLGWSFSWRSLMAAELLFMNLGLGYLLGQARGPVDAARLFAVLLVILAVGVLVDRLCFARAEQTLRRRWGYEAAA